MGWINVIRIREDHCDVANAEVSYVVMWGMSCDSLMGMCCVKHLLWACAGIQLRVVKVSHVSSLMDHMLYEKLYFCSHD